MRVAVYAGTFDPVTLGHLSVIERASALFDEVVVCVAVNPNKRPLLSVEERLELIRAETSQWPNVRADQTAGYVVEFARTVGAKYLVRGVRGATDVEQEISLAHLNLSLAPEIETVFIPAHPTLSQVGSSRLKLLAADGADLSSLCPPRVAARLASASVSHADR